MNPAFKHSGKDYWYFGWVQSPNDVISKQKRLKKIEKTLNNTHTTTQKRTETPKDIPQQCYLKNEIGDFS